MISHVVIAGAGIGGLTLATALHRRGVHVVCLERAPTFAPAGAGIALPPNGVKALFSLGLERELIAAGHPVERAVILDRTGRELGGESNLARIYGHIGAPVIALHRARLHALLLHGVGADTVRLGATVTGFTQDNDRVVVETAECGRIETQLLIGADGLRSAVRAQLVGDADGEPAYSGYTSWRGITPAGSVAAPARMSESFGAGQRLGIVDIGFGEIYWFACANTPRGGRDTDVQSQLLSRFDGWHEPIGKIIRATPPERILRTDICDRPPIERWHEGRVVLLGDAAHPMTPNLGQGAGQAIEDAMTLDSCLAQETDLETALQRYERQRVRRANAITRASRRVGAIAHWENPVAVWLRNTGMRLLPVRLREVPARRLL